MLSKSNEGFLDFLPDVGLDGDSVLNEERLESLCISIYGSFLSFPFLLPEPIGPTFIFAQIPVYGVLGSVSSL